MQYTIYMDDQQVLLIGLGVLLVIGLVCYIIAQVKSKKGELVFTTNTWDMVLLMACPVLVLAGSFMQENPSLQTPMYVLWGIAGVCLIGTMIFSIVSNSGSFWKILCSILAKVFVVWLTMVVMLLMIAILILCIILTFARNRRDDDGEYVFVKYDHFLKAYVGYRI